MLSEALDANFSDELEKQREEAQKDRDRLLSPKLDRIDKSIEDINDNMVDQQEEEEESNEKLDLQFGNLKSLFSDLQNI